MLILPTALETARTIETNLLMVFANITIASTDLSISSTIALLTSTQTLTNKTIDLDSNNNKTLELNLIRLLNDDFVSFYSNRNINK